MRDDWSWENRPFPRLFESNRAKELGIGRHRLLYGRDHPIVLPGIRMDRTTVYLRPVPRWADAAWMHSAQRLFAVRIRYPEVVAGHITAAQLYGWPLPRRLNTAHLWVATADRDLRIRMSGVTLNRSVHFDASTTFLDIPLLHSAEAFIGLAAVLDVPELVRIGDTMIGNWHGPPQTTIDEVRHRATVPRRISGRTRLMSALSLMRPTVDSPPETDLRLWTLRAGLPEPIVHPRVHCAALGQVVEPDLGYEDAHLALQYEGEHHLRSKTQWNNDIARDEALRMEGWETLKVTSRTDLSELRRKILRHFAVKGIPLSMTRRTQPGRRGQSGR